MLTRCRNCEMKLESLIFYFFLPAWLIDSDLCRALFGRSVGRHVNTSWDRRQKGREKKKQIQIQGIKYIFQIQFSSIVFSSVICAGSEVGRNVHLI